MGESEPTIVSIGGDVQFLVTSNAILKVDSIEEITRKDGVIEITMFNGNQHRFFDDEGASLWETFTENRWMA